MANLIQTGFTSARLSCDEGQFAWTADIVLASVDSYARAQVGDDVELEVFGETYRFRIDSRTIERAPGVERYVIRAISPIGFLDAPHAAEITIHYAEAVAARAAVEAILGCAVQWQLPAWTIPAGALSMSGVTPLQAARSIVEAIGGIVESLPNGDINCRFRDTVNIPDYAVAPVDHYFTDTDWITLGSIDAPETGFNRVVVSNSSSVQTDSADKLEVINDPLDGGKALIRAYLSSARPVGLVHTGAPDTTITPLGEVTRTETQVIEFIDGTAALNYPAQAMTGLTWQHVDLGAVTVSGAIATSVVAGYSLAAVTYTVQTVNWAVSLARSEQVQFILVDL